MGRIKRGLVSRRDFLKTAGIGALAAGAGFDIFIPRRSRAASKTLKILQWNHFVPGYDKWFNNTYVKEWGAKNDTEVVVDNIGLAGINARAAGGFPSNGIPSRSDGHRYLFPPRARMGRVVKVS